MRLRDAMALAAAQLQASTRLVFGQGSVASVQDGAWLALHAAGLRPHCDEAAIARATLAPAAVQRLRGWLARRAAGEPVAYIAREAPLAGQAFYVDERVIIPRSYLSEWLVIGPRNAWLEQQLGRVPARILDLCSGSGALAILAALRYPEAHVDAADVSRDALDVAALNVARHGLAARVRLHQSDLLAALAQQRYDLVLCNPPYVSESAMAALPREYQREPALALRGGGRDGLALVHRVLGHVRDVLGPAPALLLLEVGYADGRVSRLRRRYPQLRFHTGGAVCSWRT